MGISGHILGERKLRWLNRETGMTFDRAYRYHEYGSARIKTADACRHFEVNFSTWQVEEIEDPSHWWSCTHPDEV